jgi:hypothetical protein
MKKEDMKSGVVYIQCPDYGCRLWEEDKILCEYDCPNKKNLEKLIKCPFCNELIKLPKDYSLMRKINHTCKDGKNPLILQYSTTILRQDIK